MRDEGPEACQQLFARRHVSFQRHPRARPVVQIAAVGEASEDGADVVARVTLEVFAFEIMRAMELTTILNLCHHHRGFVYHHTRFGPDQKSVEVHVRPRAGSAAVCSGCHRPAPGYDHLPERRFEFIPFWGILVFFLYSMWHGQCRNCGVVVTPEAKSQRGYRSEGYGPGDEECPPSSASKIATSTTLSSCGSPGGPCCWNHCFMGSRYKLLPPQRKDECRGPGDRDAETCGAFLLRTTSSHFLAIHITSGRSFP